jgi:hypothetical protein
MLRRIFPVSAERSPCWTPPCDSLNFDGSPEAPGYSQLVRAVALLLSVGALLLAGCGNGDDEAATPPVDPSTTPATSDRPPAPPIAGTALEGEPVALADFRGRPVLVNVWSSW